MRGALRVVELLEKRWIDNTTLLNKGARVHVTGGDCKGWGDRYYEGSVVFLKNGQQK